MKLHNIKHTRELGIFESMLYILLAIVLLPLTLIFFVPIRNLSKYCKAANYVPTKLNDKYKDKTHLIAHRGYRALAPENTLPAYIEAGKAGYWGAENDIHRTKDGVWVLHHDYVTYRMMNKNYRIEGTTFDKLSKAYYDNGSYYKDYPNLRITTLEEYLQKCEEYNMVAVMEIKGKVSIDHYDEIVDMVKKYNVTAQYISFSYETIVRMRELTDAKLFYLTYKIDDDAVTKAKSVENCGVSFDGNDKDNQSQQAVSKILDAGLEPALWALDDEKMTENFVDWGVKYITTNQIHY